MRERNVMLVLTRLANEEIMIGDDIRITVVAVNGNQVRVGISAPRHLAVHRREVYEEICRENLKAAEVTPQGLRERLQQRELRPPTSRDLGEGENDGGPLPYLGNEPGSSQ
jgi:carbon storage regulator